MHTTAQHENLSHNKYCTYIGTHNLPPVLPRLLQRDFRGAVTKSYSHLIFEKQKRSDLFVLNVPPFSFSPRERAVRGTQCDSTDPPNKGLCPPPHRIHAQRSSQQLPSGWSGALLGACYAENPKGRCLLKFSFLDLIYFLELHRLIRLKYK